MSNTFGKKFTITTCGESHGPAYMAIVEGCPSNFELTVNDIQKELDRRRPGQSKYTTQRRELDEVEILSGVFEGKTTGVSIGLLIKNENSREKDYESLKNIFRPGHADYTYFKKYGIRDHRGGGRASARETALWVASGAIAKKYLKEKFNITITAYLKQMGAILAEAINLNEINNNPFFCPDKTKINEMANLIDKLRKAGDSIGARINIVAENVPVGVGEPVFNKLDAELAQALMTINAVKGVEIGDGFGVINQKGSTHRDEITPEGFLSNHWGGVLGGISTGQSIHASIAIKPASSIRVPAKSIDINHNAVEVSVTGRHDPCIGIRAVPVAEAMTALVLMDLLLQNNNP